MLIRGLPLEFSGTVEKWLVINKMRSKASGASSESEAQMLPLHPIRSEIPNPSKNKALDCKKPFIMKRITGRRFISFDSRTFFRRLNEKRV